MPGPKRKPSNIIRLNNNAGHHKKGELENEPRPEAKLPKPPIWLDRAAKAEWARVGPQLLDLGLISEIDVGVLATYCSAYSTAAQCSKAIRKAGGVAKYLSGKSAQTTPELGALKSAQETIIKCASHFGMSPSSRSRMHVATKQIKKNAEEDDFANGTG